jgi:hypothetical protein
MTDANLQQLREAGLLRRALERMSRAGEAGQSPSRQPLRSALLTWRRFHFAMRAQRNRRFQESYCPGCPHPVSDAGLKELVGFADLAALDLSGTLVTDAGMKSIAALKNLTHLRLAGTRVTGTGLKELAVLKKLTSLELDGGQKSDAGLQALREAKLLHLLSRQPANSIEELAELDMKGADVTDCRPVGTSGLKNCLRLISAEPKAPPRDCGI